MENTTEPMEIDPALDPTLDQLTRRTLLGRVGATAIAAVTMTAADAQEQEKKVHALDDETLDKKMTTFTSKTADGKSADITGFLVSPKNKTKHGSVIVIHEIFGLTDHIKDVACRFAQAGYTALAVNLFTREGEPPPLNGGFGPMMEFVGKISDAQIVSDLNAAMAMLRSQPNSNKKVGIVGFCYGGRVSMLLAGNAPTLNAAVAYYGRISGQKSDNQPAQPLDLVEKMHAPLMGHFAEKDFGIPLADVDKLRASLKDHNKKGEIFVYEGAGHAFNNDTRESYHAPSAKLAWTRTLEWFHKHLG